MTGQKNNVLYKDNQFLTDSFITQAIPIYDSLPSNISLKTTSKASLKKLKEYFWKEFLKDPKVTDKTLRALDFNFNF